jgi:hypothetical protein
MLLNKTKQATETDRLKRAFATVMTLSAGQKQTERRKE